MKEKTLPQAAEDVLRKRNRELSKELRTALEQKRKAESELALLQREVWGVKDAFSALFFAVELLAAQVSNHTRDGRGARTSARQALEKNHIRPPSTLGSSRNRKSKKKKT